MVAQHHSPLPHLKLELRMGMMTRQMNDKKRWLHHSVYVLKSLAGMIVICTSLLEACILDQGVRIQGVNPPYNVPNSVLNKSPLSNGFSSVHPHRLFDSFSNSANKCRSNARAGRVMFMEKKKNIGA